MTKARLPTRGDAMKAGLRFYQGTPCKRGHAGVRYLSTGACRDCIRLQPRPDKAAKRAAYVAEMIGNP